jgi:hypothetical protein
VPLDPGQNCLSTLAGPGDSSDLYAPDIVRISDDQLLIAASLRDTLHIYSVPDLAVDAGGCSLRAVGPVRMLQLPPAAAGETDAIRGIGWCRCPGLESSFVVLTDRGSLMAGSLGSVALNPIAGASAGGHGGDGKAVGAAAWAPDGSPVLAYLEGGTDVVFRAWTASDGGPGEELARVTINHEDGGSLTSELNGDACPLLLCLALTSFCHPSVTFPSLQSLRASWSSSPCTGWPPATWYCQFRRSQTMKRSTTPS